MKNSTVLWVCIFFFVSTICSSQHTDRMSVASHHESEHPHFRIALLLGHTLIPEEHAHENFFIPSWGLDVEYWFTPKVGLGIHNDLEIETFVVLSDNGEGDHLERVSPLVMTLDVLFKVYDGLVFQFGPGLEIEKGENFKLFRVGVEYEYEINQHWDICPTVFYDSRFGGGYHTWSIAFGIARRF